MLIALCAAVPRYVSIFHALPDFPVVIYKVMCGRISIAACKVFAVCLRPAQTSHIMNHNVLDTGNAARIEIVPAYQPVNVPHAFYFLLLLFLSDLLFLSFLLFMPLYAARGAVSVQFVRVRQLVRILGKKAPHTRPYLFYGQPA